MKITRRKGQFFNTWVEGDTVYTQDLKTGRRSTMTRRQARLALRDTNDMEGARKYANQKVSKRRKKRGAA